MPGAQPLDECRNPDGTLALPPGRAVSLDPGGYQLVSGPGEAPRFVAASPEAVPSDENWASNLFPWRGTNAPINALVLDAAGNLYAGGEFTGGELVMASGVSANHIAKWDGTAWSALGGGACAFVRPSGITKPKRQHGCRTPKSKIENRQSKMASGCRTPDCPIWSAQAMLALSSDPVESPSQSGSMAAALQNQKSKIGNPKWPRAAALQIARFGVRKPCLRFRPTQWNHHAKAAAWLPHSKIKNRKSAIQNGKSTGGWAVGAVGEGV